MNQILLLLAFNALLIEGVWFLTGPGQLGAKISIFFEGSAPEWVAKPMVQCRQCMSSVWGTVGFFTFGMHFDLPVWMWPFHCLSLCGLMALLHQSSEPKTPDL